jgi:hypothetical protein
MMKTNRKFLFFILLFISLSFSFLNNVQAQISITTIGIPYNQDFNTLANSGTTSATLPLGWAFSESGGSGLTTYGVDFGDLTAANTYSYGSISAADRAFGELSSGGKISTFGSSYQNLTGSTIGSLQISYTGEQWRQGANGSGGIDSLVFSYSVDPLATLTTGTYLNVQQLNFFSPNSSASPNNPVDGNATGNRTTKTFSITGISIPNNAIFWIKWVGINVSGNDDGLAIDDFSINTTACTAPSASSYVNTTMATCLGSAIASNSVSGISGTSPFTYSISPTLPTGLNINSSSGTISGTPTVAAASTSYTVYAANGCGSTTAAVDILVNALPTVTFPGVLTAQCLSSNTYLLTGGAPLGGTYSGTGVTGFNFDASGAGTAGSPYTIVYTYTDINACTNTATNSIVVNSLPTVTFPGILTDQCVSSSTYVLTGGTPSGGSYSGTGVMGTNFDASVAGSVGSPHTITYSYADGSGCSNSATNAIVVNALPTVSAGSYGPVCIDAADIVLSGTPSGGTFSGTGVIGSNFDPSVGTQTITYQYTDANTCTNSAIILITVAPYPLSAGTNGTLIVCSTIPPTNTELFDALEDSPAPGGTWTGPVSGIYTYTQTATPPCTDNFATVTLSSSTDPVFYNGLCYPNVFTALGTNPPSGSTITIINDLEENNTFTIPSGVTLKINTGIIYENLGTLKNEGVINNMGTLKNKGSYLGIGSFIGNFLNEVGGKVSPGNY